MGVFTHRVPWLGPWRKGGPVLELPGALLDRGTCDAWSLLCLLSAFCMPVLPLRAWGGHREENVIDNWSYLVPCGLIGNTHKNALWLGYCHLLVDEKNQARTFSR